ncbi:ABC transporter substrate-binding protein [Cohnella fermenti]|uniref:Iron-uptake system-binding protein n=1 Tax=Cohnella fermenti TaxID=2565925 RepID=A0A4S4CAT3_9BACL|nr:ABC transporter substrate-binding protein [Cohnella fermenti]THF84543.1 iron-uptake system-binding protein [Cohnella fermenti]
MRKAGLTIGLVLILAMLAAACGNGNSNSNSESASGGSSPSSSASESPSASSAASPSAASAAEEAGATRTIGYLDKQYVVPADASRIVIVGAVEAMEDSIVLDVHPVGAITFSGVFPEMFQSITDGAESIGEKMEPDLEKVLELKPDVILGSSKFPEETMKKLEKIATTIPYSHIATNWEANLELLGELSGKQEQAAKAIEDYKADLAAAQAQLGEKLAGKKVVALRIRGGEVYVYPESVFFNPVLYGDLGLEVPTEVQAAKAQESISIEKLAEMNPDYLFLQFLDSENADAPNALADLQNNPIIKNINAFKNGKAFVNVVDPLAQGGTAYSKIEFLKAAVAKLSE